MKFTVWTILKVGLVVSIGVNTIVNTADRIRRNRLADLNYQEEILKKKEERLARKLAKEIKKIGEVTDKEV